ncbi:MAG: polyprenyl synthetase family protein [Bacteroidales bacterium]|nr:polyprenyl synthetase family protein [Bacteroidales bacterium]
MTIQQLQLPVQQNFYVFQNEYERLTQDKLPFLDEVEKQLAKTPGKQLRPLLLLLSAKACGRMTNAHMIMAAAMELLHNATLMHDDVVDESDTRRGQPSVRGKWGNQVAVLCGDYYLTKVMECLYNINSPEISSRVSQTVATMCQGELKQLKAISMDRIDINTYLDIIGCKTSSLMALCCELGAMPVYPEDDDIHVREIILRQTKAMRQFGYHYGIVFQIHDDLAHLERKHDVSLPSNIDPQNIISEHRRLAIEALEPIPPSEARESLCSLLSPSAPQPS